MSIVSRDTQFAKLAEPILVKLEGRVTEVRLEQSEKAPAAIVVIDDGITTELICHFEV